MYDRDHGSGITGGGRIMAIRRVGIRDEVKELYEGWYSLCLTPGREHVMCEMVVVVVAAVVEPEEDLDAMPRQPDCIGVVPGVRMHELQAVVDGAVRVTQRVEITICTQQSLMTVVPGSIRSRMMASSVSAVLSGTGKRNDLPDPRSTSPNTH